MTGGTNPTPDGGGAKGTWDKVRSWFNRAKKSEAVEKAGDVAGKVWDKTKDVAETAWDKTKDVAGDVKDKVDEKLEERRKGGVDGDQGDA